MGKGLITCLKYISWIVLFCGNIVSAYLFAISNNFPVPIAIGLGIISQTIIVYTLLVVISEIYKNLILLGHNMEDNKINSEIATDLRPSSDGLKRGHITFLKYFAWIYLIFGIICAVVMLTKYGMADVWTYNQKIREIDFSAVGAGIGLLIQAIINCVVLLVACRIGEKVNSIIKEIKQRNNI